MKCVCSGVAVGFAETQDFVTDTAWNFRLDGYRPATPMSHWQGSPRALAIWTAAPAASPTLCLRRTPCSAQLGSSCDDRSARRPLASTPPRTACNGHCGRTWCRVPSTLGGPAAPTWGTDQAHGSRPITTSLFFRGTRQATLSPLASVRFRSFGGISPCLGSAKCEC